MTSPSVDLGGAPPVEPHLVQFYPSDDFLAGAVAAYLAAGLQAGEPMLLIATAEHCALFTARLAGAGVDLGPAMEQGRLSMLETGETLRQLLLGDLPDAERFASHIGRRVGELSARGRSPRVRVYCEMVDVLWRSGKADAAVRLEELWSDLRSQHDFTRFCAYVMNDQGSTAQRARASGAEEPATFGDTERALRAALHQQQTTGAALRNSEQQLKAVTDALPVLISYVDLEHRYRFVNEAYRAWFRLEPADLIGRHVRELLSEESYRTVAPHLAAALRGTPSRFQLHGAYRDGNSRHVEVTYTPHRGESGEVVGVIALVADLDEEVRLKQAAEAAQRRTERLLKIASAIADAVTPEQVYEALVDQTGQATGATTGALWLKSEDGRTAELTRAWGLTDAVRQLFRSVPLDTAHRFPSLDALCDGCPRWYPTVEAMLEAYPNLAGAVPAGRSYGAACVPLEVQGQTVGALGFSFAPGSSFSDPEDRPLLMLVARSSSQALERLALLQAEKRSRAQAELLFGLSQQVIRAEQVDDFFPPTLEAIERAVGAKRSAVLLYDAAGVMRFRAWRGLSDEYRGAVEGHSPWPRDAIDPQVVWVADAMNDPSLAAYRELFTREGIGALGFIPLVASGQLLGKFMVYYPQPHVLAPREVELARAIANHIAAATARFSARAELEQSVHFNEMFTSILGHDLRNPLGAIMTAAQLLMKRSGDERHLRPLARILTSGDRMALMIDQLLDFTRVRVGQGIPLRPKHTDLKQLIEHVLTQLEAAPARVELEHHGDTVGLWDEERLAQVFANLITNALHHGAARSPVTVRVDGTSGAAVRVTVHNAGEVAPQRLSQMFEPMAGTDRRGERSQGLGLGLFISQEITRAHGGALSVESTQASGTTFSVALPRAVA